MANATATWSFTSKTGGVANTDLSPASGTSTVMTGHLVGTGIIHAVISGLTSTDSGTITVNVGTANHWRRPLCQVLVQWLVSVCYVRYSCRTPVVSLSVLTRGLRLIDNVDRGGTLSGTLTGQISTGGNNVTILTPVDSMAEP